MNEPLKFILIFFFAGILGGIVFGLTLAMCILGTIYSVETFALFLIVVSIFYILSIYRLIKNRNHFVIIRKLVEILFITSLLNAMFMLEAEIIEFTAFDWNIIYICTATIGSLFLTFVILETYFPKSWIIKEINHIIKGMQIYGLLPEDEEKEIEN